MRASVIISTYNEGAALARTIETCLETGAGLDLEILIADDASTDGSVEAVLRRFTSVHSVRNEQRRGVSPTKMLGADHARGDTLVFLDAHCKPEPGAIGRLVARVESQNGTAIITPTVTGLDRERWRSDPAQAGHGYSIDLYTLECDWLPLKALRPAGEDAQGLYESPGFIGCAVALSRTLLDSLWGFDRHMRSWGVEDIDLSLKCWLMGNRILHEPAATVGHSFRAEFSNYSVPAEHVVFNELRLARKALTGSVWNQWLTGRRQRDLSPMSDAPEGAWARAWHLHSVSGESVEAERTYLHGRRRRDEFWYAERFGLDWPRLSENADGPTAVRLGPSIRPSIQPSKPPTPTVEIQVNNTPTANDDVVRMHCIHPPSTPTINCQIRLTSNEGAPVSVVLRDPTGRLAFPSNPTVTLALPLSKAFVPFTISGQNPSAAVGDAVIQARVGTAAGPIAGTRPVTVVSFSAAQIQLVQGGNYGFVGDLYTVPGGVAVTFTSRATIQPAGVDCSIPTLANIRIGIMQETSAQSIPTTWDTPTIAWLASAPSGTTVSVPTAFRQTFNFDPAVPQPINDGVDGASPLYSRAPAALTPPIGCPGGVAATSNDTPGHIVPTTFAQPALSGGVQVGTVTWTHRVSSTRVQHFRTFCVTFNTSTNVFCALRQATWDIALDVDMPTQHATVNPDGAATANPATGTQANNAEKGTLAGVGATMTFTKP